MVVAVVAGLAVCMIIDTVTRNETGARIYAILKGLLICFMNYAGSVTFSAVNVKDLRSVNRCFRKNTSVTIQE